MFKGLHESLGTLCLQDDYMFIDIMYQKSQKIHRFLRSYHIFKVEIDVYI